MGRHLNDKLNHKVEEVLGVADRAARPVALVVPYNSFVDLVLEILTQGPKGVTRVRWALK